jgi:hypothetical protein
MRVASARAVRAAFDQGCHCNLTYWEFPEYDHAMTDAAAMSHLPDVLARISDWLKRRLAGDPLPCPATRTKPI